MTAIDIPNPTRQYERKDGILYRIYELNNDALNFLMMKKKIKHLNKVMFLEKQKMVMMFLCLIFN